MWLAKKGLPAGVYHVYGFRLRMMYSAYKKDLYGVVSNSILQGKRQ